MLFPVRRVEVGRLGQALTWSPPVLVVLAAVTLGKGWSPGYRLLAMTLVLYAALKLTAILRQPPGSLAPLSGCAWLAFLAIWPGMDPAPFRTRAPAKLDRPAWLWPGLARMGLGILTVVALAAAAPRLPGVLLGWSGIAALLLTIHLGYSDVLSALLRHRGFAVRRLFDNPLSSRSLTEFWSRRWNLAFVEMDRQLFLPTLRRRLGPTGALVGVFAISGVFHELAISYPAGAGWGRPTAYFLFHGGLCALERRGANPRHWPPSVTRLWTWAWLLVPLPLLFHDPFRSRLVVPLFHGLHCLLP